MLLLLWVVSWGFLSHCYKLFFARCLLCGCGMFVGVFDLAAAVVASVVHWCHLVWYYLQNNCQLDNLCSWLLIVANCCQVVWSTVILVLIELWTCCYTQFHCLDPFKCSQPMGYTNCLYLHPWYQNTKKFGKTRRVAIAMATRWWDIPMMAWFPTLDSTDFTYAGRMKWIPASVRTVAYNACLLQVFGRVPNLQEPSICEDSKQ